MARKSSQKEDIIDLNQWLSLNEATELSGLSKQRMFQLANEGTIPTREIKGVRCWSRAELANYDAKRGRPPKSAGRSSDKKESAAA
jgi:predicted DNA-binding transcriptional regulator AlpA